MISIIMPVIRPEKAKRCVEAIKANSGVGPLLYEIITKEDTERIGAPKMVKKMTDACEGSMLRFLGGEFFHTGYRHCWCDNELCLRASELGRYIFCEKAYIYHDHVIADSITEGAK